MGEQKYKQSYYNFSYDLANEGMLLYNTRTGAISFIDKETKDSIASTLKYPNDNLDNEYFGELVKNGFVVEAAIDELELIKEVHNEYINVGNLINVILLPAETCNFRCPYCFIYSQRNMIMEDWVYQAALSLIQNKLRNRPKDKDYRIILGWFGGEPLLCKGKIIEFMNKLKRLKNDKISVESNMITNGYYLDYKCFKELLAMGVTIFQVTFDSNKEFHDKVRVLQDGGPTFDTIFNNIKEIKENVSFSDQFKISIRINFLKNSYDSVKPLIDQLEDVFQRDERFNIYCRPIYYFETDRNDIERITSDICTIDEGIHKQNELAFYIMKKRIDEKIERIFDPLPTPTSTWCEQERTNSFIIGADGSLYVCDTYVGDENLSIGKINKQGEITYNEKAKEWKIPVFEMYSIKECLQCKLLPLCMGGCRRCRISGQSQPCFWTEETIHKSLQEYAELHNLV